MVNSSAEMIKPAVYHILLVVCLLCGGAASYDRIIISHTAIAAGTSFDLNIVVPLNDGSSTFSFTWGDGAGDVTGVLADATQTHTFANAGAYSVKICAETGASPVCSVHVVGCGSLLCDQTTSPITVAHVDIAPAGTITYTIGDTTTARTDLKYGISVGDETVVDLAPDEVYTKDMAVGVYEVMACSLSNAVDLHCSEPTTVELNRKTIHIYDSSPPVAEINLLGRQDDDVFVAYPRYACGEAATIREDVHANAYSKLQIRLTAAWMHKVELGITGAVTLSPNVVVDTHAMSSPDDYSMTTEYDFVGLQFPAEESTATVTFHPYPIGTAEVTTTMKIKGYSPNEIYTPATLPCGQPMSTTIGTMSATAPFPILLNHTINNNVVNAASAGISFSIDVRDHSSVCDLQVDQQTDVSYDAAGYYLVDTCAQGTAAYYTLFCATVPQKIVDGPVSNVSMAIEYLDASNSTVTAPYAVNCSRYLLPANVNARVVVTVGTGWVDSYAFSVTGAASHTETVDATAVMDADPLRTPSFYTQATSQWFAVGTGATLTVTMTATPHTLSGGVVQAVTETVNVYNVDLGIMRTPTGVYHYIGELMTIDLNGLQTGTYPGDAVFACAQSYYELSVEASGTVLPSLKFYGQIEGGYVVTTAYAGIYTVDICFISELYPAPGLCQMSADEYVILNATLFGLDIDIKFTNSDDDQMFAPQSMFCGFVVPAGQPTEVWLRSAGAPEKFEAYFELDDSTSSTAVTDQYTTMFSHTFTWGDHDGAQTVIAYVESSAPSHAELIHEVEVTAVACEPINFSPNIPQYILFNSSVPVSWTGITEWDLQNCVGASLTIDFGDLTWSGIELSFTLDLEVLPGYHEFAYSYSNDLGCYAESTGNFTIVEKMGGLRVKNLAIDFKNGTVWDPAPTTNVSSCPQMIIGKGANNSIAFSMDEGIPARYEVYTPGGQVNITTKADGSAVWLTEYAYYDYSPLIVLAAPVVKELGDVILVKRVLPVVYNPALSVNFSYDAVIQGTPFLATFSSTPPMEDNDLKGCVSSGVDIDVGDLTLIGLHKQITNLTLHEAGYWPIRGIWYCNLFGCWQHYPVQMIEVIELVAGLEFYATYNHTNGTQISWEVPGSVEMNCSRIVAKGGLNEFHLSVGQGLIKQYELHYGDDIAIVPVLNDSDPNTFNVSALYDFMGFNGTGELTVVAVPKYPVNRRLSKTVSVAPASVSPEVDVGFSPGPIVIQNTTVTLHLTEPLGGNSTLTYGDTTPCVEGSITLYVGSHLAATTLTEIESYDVLMTVPGVHDVSIVHRNFFGETSKVLNASIWVIEALAGLNIEFVDHVRSDGTVLPHPALDYSVNYHCVARDAMNRVNVSLSSGYATSFAVYFGENEAITNLSNYVMMTTPPEYAAFVNGSFMPSDTVNASGLGLVMVMASPLVTYLDAPAISFTVLPVLADTACSVNASWRVHLVNSTTIFSIHNEAGEWTDMDFNALTSSTWTLTLESIADLIVVTDITSPSVNMTIPDKQGIFNVSAYYNNCLGQKICQGTQMIEINEDLTGLSVNMPFYWSYSSNDWQPTFSLNATCPPLIAKDAPNQIEANLTTGVADYFLLDFGFSSYNSTVPGVKTAYFNTTGLEYIAMSTPFYAEINVTAVPTTEGPLLSSPMFAFQAIPLLTRPTLAASASIVQLLEGSTTEIEFQSDPIVEAAEFSGCGGSQWHVKATSLGILDIIIQNLTTDAFGAPKVNMTFITAGIYNISVALENPLANTGWQYSNLQITVLQDLSGLQIDIDTYTTTDSNITKEVNESSIASVSGCTAMPWPRNANTDVISRLATGTAMNFEFVYDSNLIQHHMYSVTEANQTFSPIMNPYNASLLVRAVPLNDEFTQPLTVLRLAPVLVDTPIYIDHAPVVLSNIPTTFTFTPNLTAFIPSLDFDVCGGGGVCLQLEGADENDTITLASAESAALTVTFNGSMTTYNVSGCYVNLLSLMCAPTTTITIMEQLTTVSAIAVDFNMTTSIYGNVTLNNLTENMFSSNISECGLLLARDTYSTINVEVATGIATTFDVYMNGTTLTEIYPAPGVKNTTFSVPPFTQTDILIYNYTNISSSLVLVATPADTTIFNTPVAVYAVYPILVNPTLNVSLPSNIVLTGSTQEVNITVDPPLVDTDYHECVNTSIFLSIGNDTFAFNNLSSMSILFNVTGTHNMVVMMTNAVVTKTVSIAFPVVVVDDLANMTVNCQFFNSTLSLLACENHTSTNASCPPFHLSRDTETVFAVDVAQGLPEFFRLSIDSYSTDSNLTVNGTTTNHTFYIPPLDALGVNISAGQMIFEAYPPLPALMTTLMNVYMYTPIRILPNFNVSVSDIWVLTGGAPINATLTMTPALDEFDLSECVGGSWSMWIGPEITYLNQTYATIENISFTQPGDFAVIIQYNNIYVNLTVNTSIIIHVVEPLANMTMKCQIFNSTLDVVNCATNSTATCPSFYLARDAETVFGVDVAQGIPEFFHLSIDTLSLYSNLAENGTSTNYTFSVPPLDVLGINISAGLMVLNAQPTLPALDSALTNAYTYSPVRTVPNINVSVTETWVLAGSGNVINFTLVMTPELEDIDLSACIGGFWAMWIGPEIVYLNQTEATIDSVTFTQSGDFAVIIQYTNDFVNITVNTSIIIHVVEPLANMTMNCQFFNSTLDVVNCATNSTATCPSFYLARDADTVFAVDVAQGMPEFFHLSIDTLSLYSNLAENGTSTNYTFSVPPLDVLGINISAGLMVLNAQPTLPALDTALTNAYTYSPVRTVPNINVSVTETWVLAGSGNAINFTLVMTPELEDIDLSACIGGFWAMWIGPEIVYLNQTDATIDSVTFTQSGDFAVIIQYTNDFVNVTVNTSIIIHVIEPLENLTVSFDEVQLLDGSWINTPDIIGCQPIITTDTLNRISFNVTRGLVSRYVLRAGDSVYNLTSSGQFEVTANVSFADSNITQLIVEAHPAIDHVAGIGPLMNVIDVLPQTLNHTVVFLPSADWVFMNEVANFNISIEPPYLPSELDACVNAQYNASVGNFHTWFMPNDTHWLNMTTSQWPIGYNLSVTYQNVLHSVVYAGLSNIRVHPKLNEFSLNVSGPNVGFADIAYNFSVMDIITREDLSSVNLQNLTYFVDWGEGNGLEINQFGANNPVYTHAFVGTGTYNITIVVTDGYTNISTWHTISTSCQPGAVRLSSIYFPYNNDPTDMRDASYWSQIANNSYYGAIWPSALTTAPFTFLAHQPSEFYFSHMYSGGNDTACGGYWLSVDNKEYYASKQKVNFATAQSNCQALDATLATIDATQDKLTTLRAIGSAASRYASKDIRAWIGLSRSSATANQWAFSDNIAVTDCDLDIWATSCLGDPSNSPDELAAAIDPITLDVYPMPDTTALQYVCERYMATEQNYTVRFNDSLGSVFGPGNSPLTVTLNDLPHVGWTASEPSDILYIATVEDTTAAQLSLSVTSTAEVHTREAVTVAPSLSAPLTHEFENSVNVSILTPYDLWSDTHWYTLTWWYRDDDGSNKTNKGYTTEPLFTLLNLTKLNTLYDIEVVIFNSVSEIKSGVIQTRPQCIPKRHLITSTYFGYLPLPASSTEWTDATWQRWWVHDQPIVRSAVDSKIYLATEYHGLNNTACGGVWHHYGFSSFFISTNQGTYGQAASHCNHSWTGGDVSLASFATLDAEAKQFLRAAITFTFGRPMTNNSYNSASVWIDGVQLVNEWGIVTAGTGSETANFLCQRNIYFLNNFEITVNDTTPVTVSGTTPLILNMPYQNSDNSQTTHVATVKDLAAQSNNTLQFQEESENILYTRLTLTTIPTLTVFPVAILNEPHSVIVDMPYDAWPDSLYSTVWLTTPTNHSLPEARIERVTDISNHSQPFMITFNELGVWHLWVNIQNAVSDVTSINYTVNVICQTTNITIAQSFFNYLDQNGTSNASWTRANWQANYTDPPTVQTNAPALAYLLAEYSEAVGVCAGSWLQYNSVEYILIPTAATEAQAIDECVARKASLATVLASDQQMLTVLMKDLGYDISTAWVSGSLATDADGFLASATPTDTHPGFICERKMFDEHNFLMTFGDHTGQPSFTSASPMTILLTDTNLNHAAKLHVGTIDDLAIPDGVPKSTYNVSIYTRELYATPLNIKAVPIGLCSKPINVSLDAPYSDWPDKFWINWTWSHAAVAPRSKHLVSQLDLDAVVTMMEMERRGIWTVSASIYSGVDERHAEIQIRVTCDPQAYHIDDAFFSYGDTNENGTTDSSIWMSGSWAESWIGQPVTVKAKSPALFYVTVEYKSDTPQCTGRWLQFNNSEYYASAELFSFSEAVTECANLDAELAGIVSSDITGSRLQMFYLLLTRTAASKVSRGWFASEKQLILDPVTRVKDKYSIPDAPAGFVCVRENYVQRNYTFRVDMDVASGDSPLLITPNKVNADESQVTQEASLFDNTLAMADVTLESKPLVTTRQTLGRKPMIILPSSAMIGPNVTATIDTPYDTWPDSILLVFRWRHETDPELDFTGSSITSEIYMPLNTPGLWSVTMYVQNGVDDISSDEFTIKMIELRGIDIRVVFPYNDDSTQLIAPALDGVNLVLADRPFYWSISYENGSADAHLATFTDQSTGVATQTWFNDTGLTGNATLSKGPYLLSIMEVLSDNFLNVTIPITVSPKVPVVALSSSSLVSNVDEIIDIELEMTGETTGYECFGVTMGDGNHYLAGNYSLCQHWNYSNILTNPTIVDQTFTSGSAFQHTYTTIGIKSVIVFVYNFVSEAVFPFIITVGDLPCFRPRLNFIESTKNLMEPRKMRCGSPWHFAVEVSANCSLTNKVVKQWRIEKVDPYDGMIENQLDMSGLETSFNELQVTFSAQMDPVVLAAIDPTIPEIKSEIYGYFYVEPSPLHIKLLSSATSMVNLGTEEGQQLQTDTHANSLDPNYENDVGMSQFDSYQYFCKCLDCNLTSIENYRSAADGTYEFSAQPAPVAVLPNHPFGCFGGGPGRLTHNNDHYWLQGSWFHPQYTYEFGVLVFKTFTVDNKKLIYNASSIIEIKSVPGVPPTVIVSCSRAAFCVVEPYGFRVMKTRNNSFVCECSSCDASEALQYKWQVTKHALVVGFGEVQIDIDLSPYPNLATGLNERVITLNEALWVTHSTTFAFDLFCEVTQATGNKGEASVRVIANELPTVGSCEVEPKIARAILDTFTISCQDFTDPDDDVDQLVYSMLARNWDTNVAQELYTGKVPRRDTVLAAGHYTMEITAADPLGSSSAVITIADIEATPVNMATLDVAALLAESQAEGNTVHTMSLLTALSDGLMGTENALTGSDLQEYGDPDSNFATSLESEDMLNYDPATGEPLDPFNAAAIMDGSSDADYEDPPNYAPLATGQETLASLGINVALNDILETSPLDPNMIALHTADALEEPDASMLQSHLMSTFGNSSFIDTDDLSAVLTQYGISLPPNPESQAIVLPPVDPEDPDAYLALLKLGTSDATIATASLVGAPPPLGTADAQASYDVDHTAFSPESDEAQLQMHSLTAQQQSQTVPDIPSLEQAGNMLLTLPNGLTTQVEMKADTVAVQILTIFDPVTGETAYIPVQISATQVSSIDPKDAYTTEGTPVHHLLPGAPSWAENLPVRNALETLPSIVIPMNVPGCDSTKVSTEEITPVREGCLTTIQNQWDVMNDAMAGVNEDMINALAQTPVTADNALALLNTITNVLDKGVSTTVDPKTGEVIPQSLINTASTETAAALVEKLTQMLMDPDIMASLPEGEADRIANKLLGTLTSITNSQMLGRQLPLKSDQRRYLKLEYDGFETVLPMDPNSMRRPEELTDDEWGLDAAKDASVDVGKQTAKSFEQVIRAVESLALMDMAKLETGEPLIKEMKTKTACMHLKIGRLVDVLSENLGDLGKCGYLVKFPADPCDCITTTSCDSNRIVKLIVSGSFFFVLTEGMHFANNYKQFSDPEKAQTTTGLVDVEMSDVGGDPIAVQRTNGPIRIIFRQQRKRLPPSQDVQPQLIKLESKKEFFSVHSLELNRQNSSVLVHLKPFDAECNLAMFFAKTYPGPMPDQNDDWTHVGTTNSTPGFRRFSWTVDSAKLAGFTGTGYVAITRVLPAGSAVDGNWTVKWGEYILSRNFSSGYRFRALTKGCYFADVLSDGSWNSVGMEPGKENSPKYLICNTSHLTPFGAGLFQPPNSIDFEYVFSNMHFDINMSIYITLLIIYLAYIFLMVWATAKDKVDMKKLRSLPLDDNDPGDEFVYEILVSTGYMSHSGTDSTVSTIITGNRAETEIRDLVCTIDKRKTLRNGSTDSFVLTTKKSLGTLQYLRLWHDNIGKGPFRGWFCLQVVVHDCQTGIKYPFLVNRWLAVDEDDGVIERMVPVASRHELTEFNNFAQRETRKHLTDGHTWLSVFSRPVRSRFTRPQRLTSVFSLILLSMMASALYYDVVPGKSAAEALKAGPFILTAEQVFIGVLCNLIAIPINLLIIHFFRKSNLRQKRPNHINEALARVEFNQLPIKQPEDYETKDKYRRHRGTCLERALNRNLPWWFRQVAWLLCIVTIVLGTVVTWMYGIEFGDSKTRRWLTSMMVAVITSLLLTHPIKIIFMVIFCSCWCRKSDYDEEDITENEHQLLYKKATNDDQHEKFDPQKGDVVDEDDLDDDREAGLKAKRMNALLKDVLINWLFVIVVFMVTNGSRDANSYAYTQNLRHTWLGDWKTEQHFDNVRSPDEFWDFVSKVLVNSTRAFWYHEVPPVDMRGFTMDKVSRGLGYGIIRQVRKTDENECVVNGKVVHLFTHCNFEKSTSSEDQATYAPAWGPLGEAVSVATEYTYKTSKELNGFPTAGYINSYGAGGYVINLNNHSTLAHDRIQGLRDEAWIDNRTKGVFIEFGLYNAQINMFAVCYMMLESTHAGSFEPNYRFDPIRLYRYEGGFGALLMMAEAIFALFVLGFFVKIIKKLQAQGCQLFASFWNWIDILIVVSSLISLVFYVKRMFAVDDISNTIMETNGNVYVKAQLAAIYEEISSYFQGFVLFLATINVVQMLKFNRRIAMQIETLRSATQEMCAFGVMFFFVYAAFCSSFFLLLSTKIQSFSSPLNVVNEAFAAMLGKFSFTPIVAASWLAPWFFFMFMVIQAMILINMLVAIITDMFLEVKGDVSRQSEDFELAAMMQNKLRQLLGQPVTTVARRDLTDYNVDESQVNRFSSRFDKLIKRVNRQLDGSLDLKQLTLKAKARYRNERQAEIDELKLMKEQ